MSVFVVECARVSAAVRCSVTSVSQMKNKKKKKNS